MSDHRRPPRARHHRAADRGIRQFLDVDPLVPAHAASARFFDGLEPVEPGVVSAPLWRPESVDAQPLDVGCGVARKS